MSVKLSVIISVGNGSGLQPRLPGAYMGHWEFANWARSQGHEIIEFTDEFDDAFDASDIEERLMQPVDSQSLSELWIYFAGHGECSGLEADYWLLKRNNATSRDVIDIGGTVKLARRSGIPRVVIISDACRTTGDALSMALQTASSTIIPPRNFDAITPKVDRLMAAGPSTAALEVQERRRAASAYGVFTRELMRALRGENLDIQQRNVSGDRMALMPFRLELYLPSVVQSQAAAVPGGYAQRPDMVFESYEPLALFDTIPRFDVTLRTERIGGQPLEDTVIQLYKHVNHQWERIGKQQGPEAKFCEPSGLVLKATVQGPVKMIPESPLPVFELASPMQGRFIGCGEAAVDTLRGKDSDMTLTFTSVVDAEGHKRANAPGPGVFHVVTYDPLSNQMSIALQEFTPDSLKPTQIQVPADEGDVRASISAASRTHGRRGFETRVGMTLIGLNEAEPPIVAGDPGILDGIFFENNNWHIRGTRSGNVVVRVRDNFFPLPMFHGLISTVRLGNLDTDQPTILDLSFAPSEGTGPDYDLTRFDHDFKLLGESGRDELDALQLAIARCARNGFFEVAIDRSVEWAERLRQLKHLNPVFGVVAAYAYDKSNRLDQIVDMIEWFVGRFQSIPFDHVMLSKITASDVEMIVDKMGGNCPESHVAPTWPMLTQGWTRIADVHFSNYPVLKEVAGSLVPGFWTTVVGDPGEAIFNEVNEGKLQWT